MLNRRTAAPFYNPRQGPAPVGGDSTPDEHAGDASRHFATSPSAQGIIDFIESQHILNRAPAEHGFLFNCFTAGQLETLKPLRDFDTGYAVGFTDFENPGGSGLGLRRVHPITGAYAEVFGDYKHPPAHHPVVNWFREEQLLLFVQGGVRFTEDALPTHDAHHNSYSIALRTRLENYQTATNWTRWEPANPLISIENTGNQYPLNVGATYRGLVDGSAFTGSHTPLRGWSTDFYLRFILSGPHQTGFRGTDTSGTIPNERATAYGVMGYVERY